MRRYLVLLFVILCFCIPTATAQWLPSQGVLQILPGTNISISPTNGYGIVTINATGASAGGSSGQIQYNNGGVLGGFTMNGDATLNTASGAITLKNTGTAGTYGYPTSVTTDAQGRITSITAGSAPTGTVSSFSAGTLSPLFTTSVATATTTPALTFTLSNAGANTLFGNNTGGSAAPVYLTVAQVNTMLGTTNAVTGTGASPQVSFWSGTSTQTGAAAFTYAAGTVTAGAVGTQGTFALQGTTSGTVNLTTVAATGTPTFTMPTANWVGPTVTITEPTALPAVNGGVLVSTTAGVESFPAGLVGAANSLTVGATGTAGTFTIGSSTASSSTAITTQAATGAVPFILPGQTLTWPVNNASGNLSNNGSGVLSWSAAGTGTVTGTGVAAQMTEWSSASAITGTANFTDQGSGTFWVGSTGTNNGVIAIAANGNANGVDSILLQASPTHSAIGCIGGTGGIYSVTLREDPTNGGELLLAGLGTPGIVTIRNNTSNGNSVFWTAPNAAITEITANAAVNNAVVLQSTAGARSTSLAPYAPGFGGDGSDGAITTFSGPIVNSTTTAVSASTGPSTYCSIIINATSTAAFNSGAVISTQGLGYTGSRSGGSTSPSYPLAAGGPYPGESAISNALTGGGGGSGAYGAGGEGGGALDATGGFGGLTPTGNRFMMGSGGGGTTTSGSTGLAGGAGGGLIRICAAGALTTASGAGITVNGNGGTNSTTATDGGSGGGGAGSIIFSSLTSCNIAAATATAVGGAGGNGDTTGDGGGGGGGGFIGIISPSNVNSLVTANACAGGGGGTTGTGTVGTAGSVGNVVAITEVPTENMLAMLDQGGWKRIVDRCKENKVIASIHGYDLGQVQAARYAAIDINQYQIAMTTYKSNDVTHSTVRVIEFCVRPRSYKDVA